MLEAEITPAEIVMVELSGLTMPSALEVAAERYEGPITAPFHVPVVMTPALLRTNASPSALVERERPPAAVECRPTKPVADAPVPVMPSDVTTGAPVPPGAFVLPLIFAST